MHSHSWSKMLHQLGHSWSFDHRPSLTWSWRDAAWIETLPRMLAWRNLSLIQGISRTFRYHFIHQLFQLENLPFDPFVGFIWFYIDKRSGELVPSNGCTQGLYMMLIKKACPWLQALRHLVFSTRVWKWEKNKSGNGPPLASNAMKQNHYNQNLWEHASTPKL